MLQIPLVQTNSDRHDRFTSCTRMLGPRKRYRVPLLVDGMCLERRAYREATQAEQQPSRDMHIDK